MSRKKRLAVFASGTGSNFEAIVTACEQGKIPAETVALVCDKPSARVVERASRHGVKSFTFDPKSFASKVEMETVIADFLDENGVDLVCLAGYMRIISDTLLSRYDGKIINIHPSLLPAFPGARAVEQAMEYGVKVFGVTIHYVDRTVDGGRIIANGLSRTKETISMSYSDSFMRSNMNFTRRRSLGCCLFNVCNESMFSRKFMGIDLNIDE